MGRMGLNIESIFWRWKKNLNIKNLRILESIVGMVQKCEKEFMCF